MQNNMPAARPEFVHFAEAEVWAAIENDGGGPIAAEVTRLVIEMARRSKARAKNEPKCCMQVRPRCPIERVAVAMMSACVASVAHIQ
jgi:hypothetical protein